MNTLKNTEGDEQFDPNSPLSSMNKTNPFGMEASYFEDFGAQLSNRITEFEELKNDAPFLAAIPKYNPFEVPAGYFDELPNQIQELINIQHPHFSLKEWLIQFIRPNFAIPVTTTIVIAILAIQFVTKQVKQPKKEAAELSIEEQLYPIDESTLVDLLSINTETIASSGDEPITNYLIDNNVDEAILNNDYNTVDHENK